MAASTGIGFVSGVGSAGMFHIAPRVMPGSAGAGKTPKIVTGTPPRIHVDVHKGDVMRGFTGSVSDFINYIINYPQPAQTAARLPRRRALVLAAIA